MSSGSTISAAAVRPYRPPGRETLARKKKSSFPFFARPAQKNYCISTGPLSKCAPSDFASNPCRRVEKRASVRPQRAAEVRERACEGLRGTAPHQPRRALRADRSFLSIKLYAVLYTMERAFRRRLVGRLAAGRSGAAARRSLAAVGKKSRPFWSFSLHF